MKLVLATRNQGKVRELAEMLRNSRTANREPRTANSKEKRHSVTLASSRTANRESRTANNRSIEVISLKSYSDAPEVVEDGATYAENAIKKASVIAQYTGQLTLADDAGLEVNALNGAPGVNSKRWVGEDATDAKRIASLLEALEGVTDRRARFVAAIAVVCPDTDPEVVIGVCKGRITYIPAGESGFGYDPIFVPDGYEQTFAELGENIKNQISHRAKALQQALALIR
ncbi:RdgB/HAM1 family non-canonical purine NTP pyrophosphatase [Candidatus Poribacteria bacterium]|nr:RdgB/HAM1 family non-canonical purine NTP pyrophosphatase [Candidatus Poribacteria bacterium]MYK18283.1 RdgB/HAM1 family non-canonical purine NTP pyrophosphatase [Candidatus Poribacteria bacterium]